MASVKVASRYAKSLLDLAVEQNLLEEAYQDMLVIKESCENSRDLSLFLSSPIITTDKKQSVLTKLFGDRLSKISLGFVSIIVRKKREYLLEPIANAFILKYKVFKEILIAEVTTVAPIDDVTRKKVRDILSKLDHKEIELVEKTDASLIGGIILKVGDNQVDASILRQINNLKHDFSKNPYVAKL